ncbi:MAG: hypothetical protein ACR2QV_07255 [Gammaproteobacteria bacterium]
MSSSETASELEKLRAEVAALRAAKEEPDPERAASESARAEHGSRSEDEKAEEPGEFLKGQLEELTDLLETEIRDLPTITCLAVFTAGVLLGRFLR